MRDAHERFSVCIDSESWPLGQCCGMTPERVFVNVTQARFESRLLPLWILCT